MIRFLFSLAFIFISFSASAGCNEIAELRSKKLYVDISDHGCGPLEISFTYKLKKNWEPISSTIKRYPFDEECILKQDKNDQITGFSCHENGRTPLAGATYKKKQFGFFKEDCGELGTSRRPYNMYVCVAGCRNSIVPVKLEEKTSCD